MLLVLMLMLVRVLMLAVVEYPRSRVVRRMVIRRRQALRWVGVMLDEAPMSAMLHTGK
jgi:hypothetical protein